MCTQYHFCSVVSLQYEEINSDVERVLSKTPNKTGRNWVLVFCFLVRLPDTLDQSIINTRIIGEENEEKTVSFGITQFFQKQFEPIASNYVITPMMCS